MPVIERKDDNGDLIGELHWDARPGAVYEMHLDVATTHQRQGVGRAMLAELEAIIQAKSGMAVYSFSAGDNTKAHGFFTGCGFRATSAPDFYGRGRSAYFYWKPLGEPK